jgi:hypothetical protein
MKRAAHGTVWTAWEGDDTVSFARWSATGRALISPTQVAGGLQQGFPGFEGVPRGLALSLTRRGALIYFVRWTDLGPRMYAVAVGRVGRYGPAQRVDYSAGLEMNPRADTRRGRSAVAWERWRGGDVTLETSVYGAARPPDLATRFGLNIGNPWVNLALIVFGAAAGGAALTLANVFVLAGLVMVWLGIQRLVPQRFRWFLYVALTGLTVTWLFVLRPSPPSYVLGISRLGEPYGWIAAGGGVFLSLCTGRYLARDRDGALRAALMACASLYFVAVMQAALLIQAELGRV